MGNKIVIFSGPSGVGKATIEEKLFADANFNFGFSISATTRKPREGETHGKNYYFLSRDEFEKKIDLNINIPAGFTIYKSKEYGKIEILIIRNII